MTETRKVDVVVVGAGIAGVGIAAHLARDLSVAVLETEDRPGYHSTSRSAAIFIRNYGNDVIRKLSRAGHSFLAKPPEEVSDEGFLMERGILFLAGENDAGELDALLGQSDGLEEITPADAAKLVPILRPEGVARAALEAEAQDIDVDRLHQGWTRLFKRRGGEVWCRAEARRVTRDGSVWRIETAEGAVEAPTLVNAAGAWADVLAERAGVKPLGLTPMRRSAAILPPPDGHEVDRWPLFGDVGETWYAKPQSGKLMVSPSEEVPVEPHDAFVDDMDLAEGLHRYEQAVTVPVTRVEMSWAGLRTFAPDRTPVAGFDPDAPGFFWLAGQGGYGIQTAPAMAEAAAALLMHGALPKSLLDQGLREEQLAPGRLR